MLHAAFEHRARTAAMPAGARLAREAFAHTDLSDAHAVDLPPGSTVDPRDWHAAIFRTVPPWVAALLRVRNAPVCVLGIEPGDASAFDVVAERDDEVLAGINERHLDFRASVVVDGGTVTLSTVARANNRRVVSTWRS